MKHVPTPQTSVIAALAVLEDLRAQWQLERAIERDDERRARADAEREEVARRERIRARARELAHRKRDRQARGELVRRRAEQRELERVESVARARAAARIQATRRDIDAQLAARARKEWARVAGVAGVGLVALGVIGAAVLTDIDRSAIAVVSPADSRDPAAAVDALKQRFDVIAQRQATLTQAHAALVEARAAIPAFDAEHPAPAQPVSKPSRPSRPKLTKPRPTKPKLTKPEPTKRPPIVLQADGDPLDGIG